MQIEDWDIPIRLPYHYKISWAEFLHGESPKRRSPRKHIETHIANAEHLASKLGGLPGTRWLQLNGFSGLGSCIARHPDRFSHISKQPLLSKTVEEHVDQAKQLASQYNGLPGSRWLEKNGFSALRSCIRNHSDHFVNISRQTRNRENHEN